MTDVGAIFQRIEKNIQTGKIVVVREEKDFKNEPMKCLRMNVGNGNNEFMTAVFNHITSYDKNDDGKNDNYQLLSTFLKNIIQEIDVLATEIRRNDDVLISVKHQKILRKCFQIVSSFGITTCLIPGLGISLSKRCASAKSLPPITISDEQKYNILVMCTDFLYRSYNVPVLKNIIITFHLSDYLAALIQLSFAPLKKPGAYPNFTMTQEMYDTINKDKQKFVEIYEYLVSNCFQPMLMKELLVLQNVADQRCPLFVKRVIAKEMSRRLTVPGGLLSLIRCFIDNQDIDTGLEWKKVEMICKVISTKHGNQDESDYLTNITAQLKQIFTINNAKYLVTALSCLMTLYEKYNNSEQVKSLVTDIFKTLNYDILLAKSHLPGTIVLTPQEIEHSIKILYARTCTSQVYIPPELVTPNLYLLFLLRIKCTKTELKLKISNIILNVLEFVDKTEMCNLIKELLFGQIKSKEGDILIEEYNAGLTVKYVNYHVDYPEDESIINFVEIFNAAESNTVIRNLFEACLQIFLDVNHVRPVKNTENLSSIDDEPALFSLNDEKYARMLTILSEVSTSQKLTKVLQDNPLIVINFVESLLLQNIKHTNDECKTIALVLLNTILSNPNKLGNLKDKLHTFLPKLGMMANNDSEYIKILCKESMSLIISDYPKAKDSPFEEALSNIFNSLLPVRAHGIIELGKLIDKADAETISKRHYVFCLLQEQLKDPDSYIYLSAINSIASLASHCTEDVLSVLCKEYLNILTEPNNIESKENQNRAAELRMKIGDVIVKVTKRLGEMAVVHKNILLNTILCACRDEDPLIRASALSNLAEISLVLNYKMGSIIYEVLLCIWSMIESDKAIECRRAAVMVVSSLLKGLGKDTLVELKDNLLPIYRTLNKLYKDSNEDSVVRLHAQLALEELNHIVKQFLCNELPIQKEFSMLSEQSDLIFK